MTSVPEENNPNLKRSHTSNGTKECYVGDEPEAKKGCPQVVNTSSEKTVSDLSADQVPEPIVKEEVPTPTLKTEEAVKVEPVVSI